MTSFHDDSSHPRRYYALQPILSQAQFWKVPQPNHMFPAESFTTSESKPLWLAGGPARHALILLAVHEIYVNNQGSRSNDADNPFVLRNQFIVLVSYLSGKDNKFVFSSPQLHFGNQGIAGNNPFFVPHGLLHNMRVGL